MKKVIPLYQRIAQILEAIHNCDNAGWIDNHHQTLHRLAEEYLPYGSGFIAPTTIVVEDSTPNRIVLYAEYQHTNDCGVSTGITAHTITIRPSLSSGYIISSITGRNKNDIKSYIRECISNALDTQVSAY